MINARQINELALYPSFDGLVSEKFPIKVLHVKPQLAVDDACWIFFETSFCDAGDLLVLKHSGV